MRTAVLVVIAVAGLAGCGGDENLPRPDAAARVIETVDLALPAEREVDVLFLVDDSGGTKENQDALMLHFESMLTALVAGGELPDLHVGVATSSLGTLGVSIGDAACATSDEGHLQGSGVVTGRFITDVLDPTTMTRATNYTGTIEAAFTSIASVGTGGCGFEQHLEAVKVALENADGFNDGFVRDTAQLAVFIMGDEDDCSAKDPAFFGPATPALGPLDSFRCFEHAITCDQPDPRAEGPRTNCRPMASSTYLHDVPRYVDYLQGLRPGGRVTVHTNLGDPTPVVVGRRTPPTSTDPRPDLVPSCTFCEVALDGNGQCPDPTNNLLTADAGIRLEAFARAFGERGSTSRWCGFDYATALADFGTQVHDSLAGQPCLRGTPYDATPVCTVTMATYGLNPTPVAACDATASNPPCYRFVVDAARCSATPTHLVLEIVGIADAPGRRVTARCDVLP